MSILVPDDTTAGDLCIAALVEAGVVSQGQSILAEYVTRAQSRLQIMLQEWQRQRWTVWCLKDFPIVSTGALSYTVGPGGQIDTGVGSSRPTKIESAFVRQIANPENPVDYPLETLKSMEDWSEVPLKNLVSFPSFVFLQTDFPLASVFTYPVMQANIYELHIQIRAQLPTSFLTQGTRVILPFEYYSAILYNLALRLRSAFQIPTYPGDELPGLAVRSLASLRQGNVQIKRLSSSVGRPDIYNIFSDRSY